MLALSREDHRCAAVEVSGTFRGGEEAPRRSALPFCRQALTDPEVLERLRGELARAPAVPWEVGADAHAGAVTGFLQDALKRACPLRRAASARTGSRRIRGS